MILYETYVYLNHFTQFYTFNQIKVTADNNNFIKIL